MVWRKENYLSVQNILGEGPIWHPTKQRLYWVDINAGSIYWLDPTSGHCETINLGYPLGCLGFCRNDDLIIASTRGFERWRAKSEDVILLASPESNRGNARFNDGRVDSHGRFWAGTMTPQGMKNNLYRINLNGSVDIMETHLGISNGIGWSPDNKRMYLTDSSIGVIYIYDFDEATGAISNREIFVSSVDEEGVPDGLVIDREGCLWSAHWDGWKVVRYSPQGEVIQEIPLPVKRPTSCTFGGSDMTTLFITSASIDLSSEQKEKQPHAGDLFWIETDTMGLEEHFYSG